MQRTQFENSDCPIAQSLALVGEWWSILILRDAFHGLTEFDEFQQSLQLSPTMLTRRLKHLVQHRILYKHPYQSRPVRYEYLLTPRGKAFFPVLISLLHWGNTAFARDDIAVVPVHRQTGLPVAPVLMDKISQEMLTLDNLTLVPGPKAGESMKRRLKNLQGSLSLAGSPNLGNTE
ncbi:helix-turn-helix transcriptional regulator [Candidatus Sodalis endolongispinus]|uniref:Helix-turn-helix transcriptional regulator n=1 Tax=Candidatus Sodalis endolongispinus TaxID=2812662 RepID=A0ABS5YAP1_9GAMM|nr:helix-turn-helix domain-containing protein [Candidatus Sodalis endolongispinus]MBT9432006.1 helix-turn-helix transcriptional regulator [Candidatus Sodalis endolongispinus]